MDKESESRLYEISYMTKATEEEATKTVGLISDTVEKEHGIITTQTQPTRRVLSYPINGETEAWWSCFKFMIKPENISSVEEKIKDNPNILRFKIFRTGKTEMAEKRPQRTRRIVLSPAEKTDISEIDKKLDEMLGK